MIEFLFEDEFRSPSILNISLQWNCSNKLEWQLLLLDKSFLICSAKFSWDRVEESLLGVLMILLYKLNESSKSILLHLTKFFLPDFEPQNLLSAPDSFSLVDVSKLNSEEELSTEMGDALFSLILMFILDHIEYHENIFYASCIIEKTTYHAQESMN